MHHRLPKAISLLSLSVQWPQKTTKSLLFNTESVLHSSSCIISNVLSFFGSSSSGGTFHHRPECAIPFPLIPRPCAQPSHQVPWCCFLIHRSVLSTSSELEFFPACLVTVLLLGSQCRLLLESRPLTTTPHSLSPLLHPVNSS